MKILRIVLLMTAMLIGGSVHAAGEPKSNEEYSADTVLETADTSIKGRINYTPTKERREMVVEGGDKMIMIMRHDKKVAWTLMPAENMYMEMSLAAAKKQDKADPSQYKIEQTVVGPEVVNGVHTTKSKIIMTAADGGKMGGFMWLSKDNIMVKMDAIAIDKKDKMRFKTELTNLKVGKQDAKLFEIPAGYDKMEMPGMPGMGGGMPNMKDMMNMLK